jgi:hypothetical protein
MGIEKIFPVSEIPIATRVEHSMGLYRRQWKAVDSLQYPQSGSLRIGNTPVHIVPNQMVQRVCRRALNIRVVETGDKIPGRKGKQRPHDRLLKLQ